MSRKEYEQLNAVLKIIRRHKGVGPCMPTDGPGITVQVVGAGKSWDWSSDNGCNARTAVTMMKAAFEARSLLERWTAAPR